MNHAEKARDLFREGYNCAQSVVGAFHEEMGLSLSEATRLASSFGGGMGGLRETCGAVTGMFLVAGMLMGYDDPADYDGKKAHYARIRQLAEQFRQKHDTLVCRELLRSLPEKLQKTRSRVPNNITRYAPVCGSWKQQRNCWTKCCKSSDGKIDKRQYRTKSVWRLCTPSACKFPVIFHKNAREYIKYSRAFFVSSDEKI